MKTKAKPQAKKRPRKVAQHKPVKKAKTDHEQYLEHVRTQGIVHPAPKDLPDGFIRQDNPLQARTF